MSSPSAGDEPPAVRNLANGRLPSGGGGGAFACPKCPFSAADEPAATLHARDAHRDRLDIFDCPHCQYASVERDKLINHIAAMHPLARAAPAEPADSDVEDVDCESSDGESAGPASRSRTKFYPCDKCSYVTHIKARYTKHVKYHSMPMIKCQLCDFRTPYKWNLDRHMRNHGGAGAFRCGACNFTADIKQSLTVHEMNHHNPPVLPRVRVRPRRPPVALTPNHSDDSQEVIELDHQLEMASIQLINNSVTHETQYDSPPRSENGDCAPGRAKRLPRPIPNLIPLNGQPQASPPKPGVDEPPLKKFKDMLSMTNTEMIDSNALNFKSSKDSPTQKKTTFFDKLKERLLGENGDNFSLTCKVCGFESKCLSEHSVHEKNCNQQSNKVVSNSLLSLGSTRCQNCRHRCKSSADLLVHMQTCHVPAPSAAPPAEVEAISENPQNPHPMENVVFVWNTLSKAEEIEDKPEDSLCNEDSYTAETSFKAYDLEHSQDNDSQSLSPTRDTYRKVFKCPDCPFTASTASRFHVHIVGHLNKKPFECSVCKYRSNWRWDITKHIRLKSVRDPDHAEAKVLMTDETGRRNYSKYSQYIITANVGDSKSSRTGKSYENGQGTTEEEDSRPGSQNTCLMDESTAIADPIARVLPAVDLTVSLVSGKTKKTFWKCKKCDFRDASKDVLLAHVREHYRNINDTVPEEIEAKAGATSEHPKESAEVSHALSYRCGHCNQLSNWKHVIQRHCRLKHNGVINVVAVEKTKGEGTEPEHCSKCPFTSADMRVMHRHRAQHRPSTSSIFKCYFCYFFVQTENELTEHLTLHGVNDPANYVSRALGRKSPIEKDVVKETVKKHKCVDCPYETNSKSQFAYHEQFHKQQATSPYKCQVCNYGVTKRHLLHQHMKVHRFMMPKIEPAFEETEDVAQPNSNHVENEELSIFHSRMEINEMNHIVPERDDENSQIMDCVTLDVDDIQKHIDDEIPTNINDSHAAQKPIGYVENLAEIPYVWVSAKNEFHKMYKCRFCSYVNSQQCKIPNHERMHILLFDNNITIYKCLDCKYTSSNSAVVAQHSKVHGEIYGRIYRPVEVHLSDEEQIKELRNLLEEEKKIIASKEDQKAKSDNINMSIDLERPSVSHNEGKMMLYFCSKCPARFFSESNWNMHGKFHYLKFPYRCQVCSYAVPQESQLAAHKYVHMEDFQSKTKMLQKLHKTHPEYSQPKIAVVVSGFGTSEPVWIAVAESLEEKIKDKPKDKRLDLIKPKQHSCDFCPAKFFKLSAQQYHLTLHGSGAIHKCKNCDYAVKTLGNLVKHEMVHQTPDSLPTHSEYDSSEEADYKNVPISGTDLFARKTEAEKRVLSEKFTMRPNEHFPPVLQADPQFGFLMHGNPDFIYPTYLKNGRQKEKRYKCHKCPSAFEKREQYKVHLSLHGSKQRYRCEVCDYSVKYYANYVQHMRKHQMNADAQAARNKNGDGSKSSQPSSPSIGLKLAIKTVPRRAQKTDRIKFSISEHQNLKMLQRRRSSSNSFKDTMVDDKKVFACLYCPYINHRRDALENHMRRHRRTSGVGGNFDCTHCDFSAPQSHYLRDHLKVHFNYQNHQQPACFMKNDNVELVVTKISDGTVTKFDLNQNTDDEDSQTQSIKLYVQPTTGEIMEE